MPISETNIARTKAPHPDFSTCPCLECWEFRRRFREKRRETMARLRPHLEAIRRSEVMTPADYGIVITV